MAVNGQLPAEQLAIITGTSQLILRALQPGVVALRAAFEHEFSKPLKITDGYRPYWLQERIFRERYTTSYLAGRPRRMWQGRWWYQRPGTASAAVPGTSNHGWGQAIDFGSGVNSSLTSREHLWMRNNAWRFGWTHPNWAHDHYDGNGTDEPWHFEGVAVPVSNFISFPGVNLPDLPGIELPGPITPIEEDIVVTRAENQADMLAAVGPVVTAMASVNEKLVITGSQLTAALREIASLKEALADKDRQFVTIQDQLANLEAVAGQARSEGVEGSEKVLAAIQAVRLRLNRTNTAQYNKVTARSYEELAMVSDYHDLSGASVISTPSGGSTPIDLTKLATQVAQLVNDAKPTSGTFTLE